MIIVTAVGEIWVSLDRAGPWLFAVYGAAAAIAVLSALAFYLAFAAELPPPPPKALKPKKQKAVRGGDGVEDTVAAEDVEAVTAEADDAVADEAVEQTVTAEAADDVADGDAEAAAEAGETVEEADAPRRRLRNRRPSGKGRGGGVALSD